MYMFKDKKLEQDQRKVQFGDADKSTLANICMVAAERFRENAAEFRKCIDYKPKEGEFPIFPTGEAAKRLVEQFERQAAEAEKFRDLFDNVVQIPDMVTFVEEEEEAA
ncbi:hypothetical protein KEU06_09380 [Pseudaminobacter sp. 19-2017]|uniref:Uncharacterized protein n=1 Tax=Pseudaminobacter soli (ex Zhang et al. 2022) TaxID=2831468 RepID=A0A942I911_9HYPH|nr:hypothetical protein [Pseudaminobacter soli]MBS3648816.1 hypothetical protein [Pseudaminobacter soli]